MRNLERRILTLPVSPVSLRLRKRSQREDDDEEKDDKPAEADSEGGETDKQDDPEEEEGKEDDEEEKEESEGDEGDDEEGRDDGPGTIEGYAAVFHAEGDPGTEYELWSDPGMRAVERVARGAFSRAIKDGDDCRACFNHEANNLLGRTASGTLRLSEDERGLRYENDLPDTQLGRDVAQLIDRGDVTGSSFGFVVEQESWRETDNPDGSRLAVRTIEGVRLLDVGPVTYPAYAGTSAGGRSVGAPVRAAGDVAEARASYQRWKESQALPLEARLAKVRARAVQVATGG